MTDCNSAPQLHRTVKPFNVRMSLFCEVNKNMKSKGSKHRNYLIVGINPENLQLAHHLATVKMKIIS